MLELMKYTFLSLQLLDTPRHMVLLLIVRLYMYTLFPPSFFSASSNRNSSLTVLPHGRFCECKRIKQNSDLTN